MTFGSQPRSLDLFLILFLCCIPYVFPSDVCTVNPCQNNGTCYSFDPGYFCDCPPPRGGPMCDSSPHTNNATLCSPPCLPSKVCYVNSGAGIPLQHSCVTPGSLQDPEGKCFRRTCPGNYSVVFNTQFNDAHCGICELACSTGQECWVGACMDSSYGPAIYAGVPIFCIGILLAIFRVCLGSIRRDLRDLSWPLFLTDSTKWYIRRPREVDKLVCSSPRCGPLGEYFGVTYTWYDTVKMEHNYMSIFYRTWADDMTPYTKMWVYVAISTIHFLCSALLLGFYTRQIYDMCGDVTLVASFAEYLVPFVSGFLAMLIEHVCLIKYAENVMMSSTHERKRMLAEWYLRIITVGGMIFWICLDTVGYYTHGIEIGGNISGRHMFRAAILAVVMSWGTEIPMIIAYWIFRRVIFGIKPTVKVMDELFTVDPKSVGMSSKRTEMLDLYGMPGFTYLPPNPTPFSPPPLPTPAPRVTARSVVTARRDPQVPIMEA